MSSIADALKRAQQERERLRAPQADPSASPAPNAEASLASVVLQKRPATTETAAAAPPTRPPSKNTEAIIEDYASKRNLHLPESIVVYHERAGRAAEQYRHLRDGLMAANPRRDHQLLTLTSSVPKEGKTVTVMNLGLSLAEIRSNRVLLLDGNLHTETSRTSLSAMLKLHREPGLSEWLRHADSPAQTFLKATPWHNLFVLPSGTTLPPVAAAQLLQTPALHTLLWQLRATFDWILIDAPAALTLPDAGLFAAHADAVHLVVALHRTPEEKVQTTLRRLKSMNLPVKSAILTHV
jgi:Mrp family chromosome partitioning ATPase